MSGPWSIRRANAADLGQIMALETATFVSDAWTAEAMLKEIGGKHGYYLVARAEDDALDGYAGLLAPLGSPQADIQTVAVAPRARRQGLGRTLLLALVAEARRRGAAELFLEVRADNRAARELYTTLGFERIGVRERYYQPDGVDADVMRLVIPPTKVTPA